MVNVKSPEREFRTFQFFIEFLLEFYYSSESFSFIL